MSIASLILLFACMDGGPAERSAASPEKVSAAAAEPSVAVGGSDLAPLPPPSPPVDPRRIPAGPWRGLGWVEAGLSVTGSVGGKRPARGEIVATGGYLELGLRLRNWLGVGVGFSRQIHDEQDLWVVGDDGGKQFLGRYYGYLTHLDLGVFRLYWPLAGRVQPWMDLGAGIGLYDASYARATTVTGHLRSSVGVELWLAKFLSFNLGIRYRANFIENATGHDLQGFWGLSLHW